MDFKWLFLGLYVSLNTCIRGIPIITIHHYTSLTIFCLSFFFFFFLIPSGCRHITLCCSAFQGQSTVAWLTASKTLFYLLFLNNCLQASAVLKNVNASDSEMKRHTQTSLKLKNLSENFTHGVKSQNIHVSAKTYVLINSLQNWHLCLNAENYSDVYEKGM